MASITSMMNSNYNTSSIYGTRNVLSGLASGMDTETMIENAVSGIKKKIQSLYQKRTKVEWQQEAYRSIIDKAVNLGNKYTSYSSKTNLLSGSFFNNAVITSAKGTYADKVTASGKTTSDIKINAVKQLATAASYTVSGGAVFGEDFSTISGSKGIDLDADMSVSTISGSLTLQYGGSNGTSFNLDFGELDVYESPAELAAAIKEKLGEQTWTYTKNGVQETVKGSDVVDVQVGSDGTITFSDATRDGNNVYISSASGDIKKTLRVDTGSGNNKLKAGNAYLNEMVNTRDYLSDKSLSFTLNGTTKTINLSDPLFEIGKGGDASDLVKVMQEQLDDGFGANKIKVDLDGDGKLSFKAVDKGSTLTLSGSATKALGLEEGDSNYINTSKTLRDLLGDRKSYNFEINGVTIKADGDTTLESLMNSINANANAGVKVSYSKLTNEFKFTATETGSTSKIEFGGLAKEIFNPSSGVKSSDSFADVYGIDMASKTISFRDPASSWRTIDFTYTSDMTEDDILSGLKDLFKEKGLDYIAKYDEGKLVITDNSSGKQIDSWEAKRITVYDPNGGSELSFEIKDDTTMQDIVDELNSMMFQPAVSDLTASFDKATGKIIATNRETGETFDIRVTDAGKGGEIIEHAIPSYSTYTAGTDAIMDVEINGTRFESLSRSSNSFDLDGLIVNVKDTFNVDGSNVDKDGNKIEPLTFETVTDSDKIVDAIREFVNDYNEMVTELKNAYSTQPAYKNKTTRYEPLTAEEEEGYTESQLAAHNEKAKQGILFGDTTLSSMYSKLLSAIAPGGSDGQTLRQIGIGTSYENGLTTLSLDEDKLRAALDSEPEKVKNAFTKTMEGGSSSDGLMQTIQNTLNTYVKTTGEPKGVLITKAGSIKAPTSLSNNSLNTQISNIDKQIERWQDKMSSQIDRYTKQFSKLEQLVAAMNSQASALSGLMGGYEGY